MSGTDLLGEQVFGSAELTVEARPRAVYLHHEGFGTPLVPRDFRSDPPGLRSHEPSGSQISRGRTPAFMRRRPRWVARCSVHVPLGEHLQPYPTSFLPLLSTQHSLLVTHLGAKGAWHEERETSDTEGSTHIGMPDQMTEPRGNDPPAPAEGRAPEPMFSSGNEFSGRGQQVCEYLKLHVQCPRPSSSSPSSHFECGPRRSYTLPKLAKILSRWPYLDCNAGKRTLTPIMRPYTKITSVLR